MGRQPTEGIGSRRGVIHGPGSKGSGFFFVSGGPPSPRLLFRAPFYRSSQNRRLGSPQNEDRLGELSCASASLSFQPAR